MSEQHSPGPWRTEGFSVVSNVGNFVCSTRRGRFGFDNDQANARLIAQAPQMLEVLKAFVRMADGQTNAGKLILDEHSPLVWAAWDVINEATRIPAPNTTIPLCPHGRISGRRCNACPDESARAKEAKA